MIGLFKEVVVTGNKSVELVFDKPHIISGTYDNTGTSNKSIVAIEVFQWRQTYWLSIIDDYGRSWVFSGGNKTILDAIWNLYKYLRLKEVVA